MRYFYILFFIIILKINLSAQILHPEYICNLPSSLTESSGLFTISENEFWSFEDSGNADELVKIDNQGTKIKTVKISNASNEDWEAMTDDGQYTYIGDVGNNTSNRTNLVIYKISTINNVLGTSISPQKINFTYEDQIDFNPPIGSWEFDCESILAINDSLYLFSKDYTVPFKGQTKVYKLSKSPTKQVAKLVTLISTNDQNYNLGQITDAAISPNKKVIVLLANSGMYVFDNYEISNFWNGRKRFFQFDSKLQREGVSFLNDSIIYLTNEFSTNGDAALYKLNLSNILTSSNSIINIPDFNITYFIENQWLNIQSNISLKSIVIIDFQGKIIEQKDLKMEYNIQLPLSIASGNYILRVETMDNKEWVQKIRID